jgi:hypothetical protein
MADEASGNGTEPQGRSERDRFETFLKKLLEVPKAEVDALRKREKSRKTRA